VHRSRREPTLLALLAYDMTRYCWDIVRLQDCARHSTCRRLPTLTHCGESEARRSELQLNIHSSERPLRRECVVGSLIRTMFTTCLPGDVTMRLGRAIGIACRHPCLSTLSSAREAGDLVFYAPRPEAARAGTTESGLPAINNRNVQLIRTEPKAKDKVLEEGMASDAGEEGTGCRAWRQR
jgi:hypothetical protein